MLTLLALQILNLSIYNTNFYIWNIFENQNTQLEDSNPIDSFAEFVIEDIGGIENAFPETSHKNDKQSGELKHDITFKMISQDRIIKIPEKPIFIEDTRKSERPLFCDSYSYLFWKEINQPPS